MSFVLKKDRKTICSVKSTNPPTELSNELNIHTMRHMKVSGISMLPQFSLYPAPENSHEKHEWRRFLDFLHKYDMIAIADFEPYKFYILPPAKASTSTPVTVAYQIGKTCVVDSRPRDCESAGSHLAEEHRRPNTLMMRGPANGAEVCSSDPNFPQTDDCANHSMSETCDELKSKTHMNQDRLFEKNYIRADPSYLKTLGQAHSGWIFGGIAELVDNSRDAKASKLDIFVEMIKLKKSGKNVPMLSIIDNGQGMNHDEIVKMVSFGHKQPDKDVKDHIGRFGIGFKTGAMRLGRDVLVLTQTANSRSLAFLSQSLNEGKDNIEIPIVSYCRQGQQVEIDTAVQSEALAKNNLKAIKDFSPFDKYLIGEKAALFCGATGTQIYIWNLDEWGSGYCLEWHDGLYGGSSFHQGDIFVRSRRIRSRQGQVSVKVPLDFSLRAYLEVIFLVPRMKMFVQGTLVKSRPLAKFLTKTVVESGDILGNPVELTLGYSELEWEQGNCGIFLYWHGRLIEAYKRVGGMIHSADVGRGIIGVIDVTNIMDDKDGRVWVHNNKQGFQDSESYALLEEWLAKKVDEYWDKNFDSLKLHKDNRIYKPDSEWVQCDKCRKWRMLPHNYDVEKLPMQWFCYMQPFGGQCSDEEQKMAPGTVNLSDKRSGYDCKHKDSDRIKVEGVMNASGKDERRVSFQIEETKPQVLKRLRRGPPSPNHENAKSRSPSSTKLYDEHTAEKRVRFEIEKTKPSALQRLRRGPPPSPNHENSKSRSPSSTKLYDEHTAEKRVRFKIEKTKPSAFQRLGRGPSSPNHENSKSRSPSSTKPGKVHPLR
ncbi:MORC family CW-type zinc finger protein 3 isoform X3 [Arachis ipaensis]|uniref:MORC family CW-type zinc finger protein 3 isoform X3 n=1 Tax=Arachis ipaensis TaxID=130454 RepID=UPI0007AFD48B|nr:MORC family CW-type zinc finger protein 3 isoform X3 [Arachis ipaensis]